MTMSRHCAKRQPSRVGLLRLPQETRDPRNDVTNQLSLRAREAGVAIQFYLTEVN